VVSPSLPAVTSTRPPTATPTPTVTPITYLIPTVTGPLDVGVSEDEVRQIVEERLQGLTDAEVTGIRLVASRQLAALPQGEQYFGGDPDWCATWQPATDDTPVYVVQSHGSISLDRWTGTASPATPEARTNMTVVDAATGHVLADGYMHGSRFDWWEGVSEQLPAVATRKVVRREWRPTSTATLVRRTETPGPSPTPYPTQPTRTPFPSATPITSTANISDLLRVLPLRLGNRWEYTATFYDPVTGWRQLKGIQTVSEVLELAPERRLVHVETRLEAGVPPDPLSWEWPEGAKAKEDFVLPEWLLMEGGVVRELTDEAAAALRRAGELPPDSSRLFMVFPPPRRRLLDQTMTIETEPHLTTVGPDGRIVGCFVWRPVLSAMYSTDSWVCPLLGIVRQFYWTDRCGGFVRIELDRFVPAP
jgi:hypothetical protein